MEERAVRVAKEREREKGLANAATKPGLYVGSRILRFRLQHVNPGSPDPQPPPPVKKIIFHSKVTKTLTLDETLLIINKSKHPPKRVNTKNKMEGLTCKKTKEPPKKANHKGNIKFLNLLSSCREKHIK